MEPMDTLWLYMGIGALVVLKVLLIYTIFYLSQYTLIIPMMWTTYVLYALVVIQMYTQRKR